MQSLRNGHSGLRSLARLNSKPGYKNSYTEQVDEWVAAYPLTPSSELLTREPMRRSTAFSATTPIEESME
jgi:hypothetical protein